MLVVGNPHPPEPRVIHAAGCNGELGTPSDHVSLGDGYIRALSHLLEEFLLTDIYGESAAGVNGLIEGVEVGVDLGLRDCCVVVHDVDVEIADADLVEALVGVLECGEHPLFERGGTDVDGDAVDVYILG